MADLPRPLPPKKDVALALLEGPSVFVHLDPRRPGVLVPKWFVGQPQLVLQVGLNMAIPIPDLKVDEDGVSCTLSFSRTPFWCSIPWSAVYALVGEDGRGMVWPNDVPPELVSQMQQKMGAGAQAQKPARKQRAKLAAVDAPEAESGRSGSPSKGRGKSEAPREEEALPEYLTKAKPAEREPSRPVEKPARAPEARPAAASPRRETPTPPSPPAKSAPAAPAGQKKPKRELPPYLRVIK
ncbi:MAG TPA: ClpXP protease specificity-enhancing factor SspB [Polyangiaceae bacterium]|nr:ClpXP protease specificity-enhancing factor SspB [Polyangiaceae bacterium]